MPIAAKHLLALQSVEFRLRISEIKYRIKIILLCKHQILTRDLTAFSCSHRNNPQRELRGFLHIQSVTTSCNLHRKSIAELLTCCVSFSLLELPGIGMPNILHHHRLALHRRPVFEFVSVFWLIFAAVR